MSSTTEKYVITIEIEAHSLSPFGLGYALNEALKTMPDDTLDWVFEQGAASYTLNLAAPYATAPGGAPVVGTARLWPLSTDEEAERVATALTLGLDECGHNNEYVDKHGDIRCEDCDRRFVPATRTWVVEEDEA